MAQNSAFSRWFPLTSARDFSRVFHPKPWSSPQITSFTYNYDAVEQFEQQFLLNRTDSCNHSFIRSLARSIVCLFYIIIFIFFRECVRLNLLANVSVAIAIFIFYFLLFNAIGLSSLLLLQLLLAAFARIFLFFVYLMWIITQKKVFENNSNKRMKKIAPKHSIRKKKIENNWNGRINS